MSLLLDLCVGGVWFVVGRRLSDTEQALAIAPATTAIHLGVLGGIMFLTYTLGTLVSGRVSDRFGRRRLMLLGAGIYAIAAFLCSQTDHFVPLTIFFLLLGLGGAVFWPPTIAWLSEEKSGAGLRWALGCFCVAWNFGILLGSLVAGMLYVWSPSGAIKIFAITMAVSLLAVLWPTRSGQSPDFAPQLPEEDPLAATREARSHHFVRAAWAANFATILGLAGATSLFPQLATAMDIVPPIHGRLTALIRFTAIVTFVLVQWTVLWRHRTWPLIVSQIVGVASMLILARGQAVGSFAVAFLLLGISVGFNYYASVYYSLEAYPLTKGKGAGFHEAVLGAGLFLGPILSGGCGSLVSSRWPSLGLRAPYYFCAAFLFLGMIAQLIPFFNGKTPARPRGESEKETAAQT